MRLSDKVLPVEVHYSTGTSPDGMFTRTVQVTREEQGTVSYLLTIERKRLSAASCEYRMYCIGDDIDPLLERIVDVLSMGGAFDILKRYRGYVQNLGQLLEVLTEPLRDPLPPHYDLVRAYSSYRTQGENEAAKGKVTPEMSKHWDLGNGPSYTVLHLYVDTGRTRTCKKCNLKQEIEEYADTDFTHYDGARMYSLKDIQEFFDKAKPDLLRGMSALVDDLDIFKRTRDEWGEESQEDVLIEEMAELTTAIIQRRRGRIAQEDVMEELADVLITAAQCRHNLGAEAVDKIINLKLKRLASRLPEENTDEDSE